MAETTGLLNRRWEQSYPRVRISFPPQVPRENFSRGFLYYIAPSRYIGVMDVDVSQVVEVDEELAGVAGTVFAFGGLAHG